MIGIRRIKLLNKEDICTINFFSIITRFYRKFSGLDTTFNNILLSTSVSSWIFLFGWISREGTTGVNQEYFFKVKEPWWWIWFMAKSPWDFIIFTFSSREGWSLFSSKYLVNPTRDIPSCLTTSTPNKYLKLFLEVLDIDALHHLLFHIDLKKIE